MTGPLSLVVESVAGSVCDVRVMAAVSPAFPVAVVSWALSYACSSFSLCTQYLEPGGL